jgi:NADPH:quinone reductase-like Zn-dependent oxidoreductase
VGDIHGTEGGATMKAIGLTEFGGPEVLKVIDIPEPHPGPAGVRMRVHSAAVNLSMMA